MFTVDNKTYETHIPFIGSITTPLFFSARASKDDIFIVKCFDEENAAYYACETTKEEIFKMLDQQITMYDMFVNKKTLYEIHNNVAAPVNEFNPEYLPEQGVCYTIETLAAKGHYNYLKNHLDI